MKANPSSPNSLQIYLIRHEETEWSLSGQYSGRADISLTVHGEDEARKVGQRLCNIPFAHVLTSPLKRAQQTCALAALEPTPRIEPDLVEWDYGDYGGQRSAEIQQAQPGWNIFRDGAPNGETPVQVSDRADRLIANLRTLNGDVALFSHGHFGRALAMRWIGLPVTAGQHFLLGTASLSIFSQDVGPLKIPVITMWNATSEDLSTSNVGPRTLSTIAKKPLPIERWENEGGEIPDQPLPPTDSQRP